MSHTIFRLIKSSDELQKADQELKSAAEKLLRGCMK